MIRQSAELSWRSPPRFNRCRVVLPLLAGDRVRAGQGGEGPFVAQPVWVVAGADQDGGRGVRTHALAGHQIGCDRGGDPAQADLRAGELLVEQLDALGEFPHSQPRDCGQAVVVGPDPECCAGLDELGVFSARSFDRSSGRVRWRRSCAAG